MAKRCCPNTAATGGQRRIQPGKDTSIYIPSKSKRPGCCDTVRLDAEASRALDKLAKITGQSKRYLASELILQGAANVVFYAAECRQCPDVEICPHAILEDGDESEDAAEA